jgi:alpha/beta hydrolase fold
VAGHYARPVVTETDVRLREGRTLRVYDAAGRNGGQDRLAVFWQHGTPNLGAPPEPLLSAADRLGIRWVSHDRPGYGGSTTQPGRDLASVAADVAGIADELGIGRFTVIGHSGGGPMTWPAGRCCRSGCWEWSARPGWRPWTPKAWTGSRAWPPPAWPSWKPRPVDGRPSSTI